MQHEDDYLPLLVTPPPFWAQPNPPCVVPVVRTTA
jgi:hypothetical protein